MDVGGVAEEKRAACAEPIGDSMVDAIRREPVHARDVDANPLEDARPHVVPRQVVVRVFGSLSQGPDEPRTPSALQRKHGEKVRSVQRHVQLAVHRLAAGVDVGDVEEMRVGPARETDTE